MTTTQPTPTPSPASLSEALLIWQARKPTIKKSLTAEVATRSGPDYQYSYADLAIINEAADQLLTELGLLWTTDPSVIDVPGPEGSTRLMLRWRLEHVPSQQAKEGLWPLRITDNPQAMGSSLTFGRRYCKVAVLGLAPEDDDDAAAAAAEAEAAPKTRTAQRQQRAARAQAAPTGGTGRAAPAAGTTAQRSRPPLPNEPAERREYSPPHDPDAPATNQALGAIASALGAMGVADRDARIAETGRLVGKQIKSGSELTAGEAHQLMNDLTAAQEHGGDDPLGYAREMTAARRRLGPEPDPEG